MKAQYNAERIIRNSYWVNKIKLVQYSKEFDITRKYLTQSLLYIISREEL